MCDMESIRKTRSTGLLPVADCLVGICCSMIESGFEIPATVESVANCGYATTLMRTGVMLSTVEHLLSALRGLGIDNTFIEVDNLEIPIMDGSAEVFADMIERAGVVEQPLARRALLVRERMSFEQ